MTSQPLVRIGTRGSPLALAQTHEVRDRLAAAFPELAEAGAIEVVAIRTTGDKVTDRPLADIGGKGLFTKEIDAALLSGRIDLAVHSVKDVPTWLPDGVAMPCILPREEPWDVLIAGTVHRLAELPKGAVVGTASLRRQAQILHRRPDLQVVTLRGNVETRLAKVQRHEVDATVLAAAGLRRLGMAQLAAPALEAAEMLPAVGQGAIGITCRGGDARVRGWLEAVDDPVSRLAVAAERALLAVLDGSCRTPIAGFAQPSGDGYLRLRGLVASADGRHLVAVERRGPMEDAEALGRDAGRDLRSRVPAGVLPGAA